MWAPMPSTVSASLPVTCQWRRSVGGVMGAKTRGKMGVRLLVNWVRWDLYDEILTETLCFSLRKTRVLQWTCVFSMPTEQAIGSGRKMHIGGVWALMCYYLVRKDVNPRKWVMKLKLWGLLDDGLNFIQVDKDNPFKFMLGQDIMFNSYLRKLSELPLLSTQ